MAANTGQRRNPLWQPGRVEEGKHPSCLLWDGATETQAGSAAGPGEAWACNMCNMAGSGTVHPEINCALDSLIWISTSLAYLELAWAPKSLRLQNPSPTSLLPKHKAGVILHSPHKSVLRWWSRRIELEVREREILCFFQHVRSMRKAQEQGWPSVPSPPCAHTRPVTDPGPGGVSWGGHVLCLKCRSFNFCTTWKWQTLGLTKWPSFAFCEAIRTPNKLYSERMPGTAESPHVQVEITRNVIFLSSVSIFCGYLGIVLKKYQSQTTRSATDRNKIPLC